MSLIAGIDLGTTNSLIGVMEAGFPIILADADGERLTPSAVHFPADSEPLIGRAALRMRAIDSENTVLSIKRFMGRRIGEASDATAFRLTGRPGEPAKARLRDREYLPEEISALILAK